MADVCFFRLGATPLFISDSQSTFGGAEVRAFIFANGLASRSSHAVSFAVHEDARLPPATSNGISMIPMPGRHRGVRKMIHSMRSRFGSHPPRYQACSSIDANVVACFGVHDPTPNVIAAAGLQGQKTILFLTSSEDVAAPNADVGSRQRRREKNRLFALRNADAIVVQTEYQQAKLSERFGLSSHLIRNPIDCRVENESLNRSREHVLWVGRADSDSKRADICLALAKNCPDVRFRIVLNDADSEFGRQLLADCPSNVTVDHRVPLDEIDELYSRATVLINTSVSEGFPNAFLQAAKFATPIVSLTVDPDGMLRQYGCGEVADSERRMIELVREYHQRGPRVAAIANTARDYVQNFHSLEERIDELEQVIDGLMNGQQRRQGSTCEAITSA